MAHGCVSGAGVRRVMAAASGGGGQDFL